MAQNCEYVLAEFYYYDACWRITKIWLSLIKRAVQLVLNSVFYFHIFSVFCKRKKKFVIIITYSKSPHSKHIEIAAMFKAYSLLTNFDVKVLKVLLLQYFISNLHFQSYLNTYMYLNSINPGF